jgi:formylglycine-generating enzyme required for sulfatase activity/dienelactone hydrolase
MEKQKTIAEQLFGEALDLPPEQRAAFLDAACCGSSDVRQAVEVLLGKNDRLNGFLSESPYRSIDSAVTQSGPWLAPGTRLGRYSIVEPLGAGGMGIVYRARDEKLERVAAIKMLAPGIFSGDEARRRFRREALALAKLNHSHIAAVYDVGEQDGIDYIVMECVAGESLAAKVKRGPLAVEEATSIALEIAQALEEAHEHGVIHRDLKPANVMITPKGQAKVLDFGVAKLLETTNATQSLLETTALIGTPLYMSPEQALGREVDARTDLWSLGAIYYEMLTGRPPFQGGSAVSVLRAVTSDRCPPIRQVQPALPEEADRIVSRALEKDPARRYATASEMAHDLRLLLEKMSGRISPAAPGSARLLRILSASLAVILLLGTLAGWWLYHRAAERRWAREEAIPKIKSLIQARRPLEALPILERAERDLPGDAQLRQISDANTQLVDLTSQPEGAQVSIQDYLTPQGSARQLGTTPLKKVRIPRGYFRWTVVKPGVGRMVVAPKTDHSMDFPLALTQQAPPGMVYVRGGSWRDFNGFIGWMGPYAFPPYNMDRYEVTNRAFQEFVDHGGYEKPQYWPAEFHRDGRTLTWSDAMPLFRDTTNRPGPSTWAGGHYPERQSDFPVSGVSWFEAAAYAAWAGKALPVLGQWYQAANFENAAYTAQLSNLTTGRPAAAGAYQGLGNYGTYDMAGNVREWIANPVDNDLRFILGGSWKSPTYLYTSPEALPPFDRSGTNGFRCVRNLGAIPAAAAQPVRRLSRDFAKYKPVSDEVFRAYKLLYAYPDTPLNAVDEGVVKETVDWREDRVTFDAAYNGERMAAYLFLPKRVQPPYQTVIFFPSARVMFMPPDSSNLGDVDYFDYIIQSGRAVMYPIYDETYERRLKNRLPATPDSINEPENWYKDAARSLDYLVTRADIDKDRIGYLGVSMGSAEGVIITTLLQDRLRAAVFLDGGYFLVSPGPGTDQADFAPRMKKPVLMVNGRYDFTFPVQTAQDPLFRMLGTPAAEKRHVLLETPHDVTQDRPRLVKEVLSWLDRYLGRVGG